MALTKIKIGLIALVLAGVAITFVTQHQTEARLREEIQSLRQRIAQLQNENEGLSNRSTRAKWAWAPRLPALPMEAAANALPTEDLPSTNLYARFKDQAPKLTADQVEAFLKANGRKASSLLAAYRTSGDPALLKEAMEKYPNDPHVAFEAAIGKDLPPEQRREWLNAFKQAAPENALANYLSAREYIKAGHMDQAVQEPSDASGKQALQDYTLERAQDDQEAYLSAGYSAAEAERISLGWLELPQLGQVKQLGRDLIAMANAYSQSGDQASAQAVLQMAMNMGQRYADAPANETLISKLMGMAVERPAADALGPHSASRRNGRTAQDQPKPITQRKEAY